MKKVLIIAYYFPPAKTIAASRPKSFADNFSQHGLFPIILTRHWAGDEHSAGSENVWGDFHKPSIQTEVSTTEEENYRLIKVPYSGKMYADFKNIKNPLSRKISLLHSTLKGFFHIETNAYESMLGVAEHILDTEDIDSILVSTAPLNSIKLGAELAKKFKKPLVIDFRDLWNNSILSANYKPNLTQKYIDTIQELHIKNWLKQAHLVVSVSQPLLDEVSRLNPNVKTLVITNGYEQDLFDNINSEKVNKFTFSVVGTLYPQQDLSILIDGLNAFAADKSQSEVQLNFIGAGVFPEVQSMLKSKLPAEITYISARIPREEALEIMFGSHVLSYAGWKGSRGIISGKIFEYLGAKKNVLIAPGDDDVMDDLVISTQAGKIANSVSEFCSIMNQWFNEWRLTGKLQWNGDSEKISYYSRENQAKILATAVKDLTA